MNEVELLTTVDNHFRLASAKSSLLNILVDYCKIMKKYRFWNTKNELIFWKIIIIHFANVLTFSYSSLNCSMYSQCEWNKSWKFYIQFVYKIPWTGKSLPIMCVPHKSIQYQDCLLSHLNSCKQRALSRPVSDQMVCRCTCMTCTAKSWKTESWDRTQNWNCYRTCMSHCFLQLEIWPNKLTRYKSTKSTQHNHHLSFVLQQNNSSKEGGSSITSQTTWWSNTQ